jgi:hypothetical protein
VPKKLSASDLEDRFFGCPPAILTQIPNEFEVSNMRLDYYSSKLETEMRFRQMRRAAETYRLSKIAQDVPSPRKRRALHHFIQIAVQKSLQTLCCIFWVFVT